MAQRSARRDRDNQCAIPYLEYAAVIWDPVRELPYRPAAVRCRTRGRTDGSIRPRATTVLKFPLARKGASTDGSIRPRATTVLKFPLARKGASTDGAWIRGVGARTPAPSSLPPIGFPGRPERWWRDEALQAEAEAAQASGEQRHHAARDIPALRTRSPFFSTGVR